MASWAVVVPSCRPESLAGFLDAWTPYLSGCAELFVVHDAEPWTGIPDDPAFPRRTDAIRSWGFVRARRSGAERVLSLDDDVRPVEGVDLLAEYDRAFDEGAPCSPHLSVGALTGTGLEMRGFPLGSRPRCPVAFQVGGWLGVPDLDARTQLAAPEARVVDHARAVLPVPRGVLTTVCAMNLAVRADRLVWLWQLPLLDGARYLRWHDIWAGILAKRCADAAGEAVLVNGRALVYHSRASDPTLNAAREASGYPVNERIWDGLPPAGQLRNTVPRGTYGALTDEFARLVREFGDGDYADHLLRARDSWLRWIGGPVGALVVARNEEETSWLAEVPTSWTVSVVQKGRDLPNVGREASSYLWWIEREIADGEVDPSEVYAFVQARPWDHGFTWPGLASMIDVRGFVPFDRNVMVCQGDGQPHHGGLPLDRLFVEWQIGTAPPERYAFHGGAQFAVDGATLLRHSAERYAELRRVVETHPVGPWVMERFWAYLWP